MSLEVEEGRTRARTRCPEERARRMKCWPVPPVPPNTRKRLEGVVMVGTRLGTGSMQPKASISGEGRWLCRGLSLIVFSRKRNVLVVGMVGYIYVLDHGLFICLNRSEPLMTARPKTEAGGLTAISCPASGTYTRTCYLSLLYLQSLLLPRTRWQASTHSPPRGSASSRIIHPLPLNCL